MDAETSQIVFRRTGRLSWRLLCWAVGVVAFVLCLAGSLVEAWPLSGFYFALAAGAAAIGVALLPDRSAAG
jgi:hypothetical protein